TERLISSNENPCRLFQYSSVKSSLMTLPYNFPNPAISLANFVISVGFIVLLLLLHFFIHPVCEGGVGMLVGFGHDLRRMLAVVDKTIDLIAVAENQLQAVVSLAVGVDAHIVRRKPATADGIAELLCGVA